MSVLQGASILTALNADIEFAVLIAIVVAAFNLGVHKLPPADPARVRSGGRRTRPSPADERPAHDDARRTWAWLLAWVGFACALVAVIGLQSVPSLRVLWIALVAVSIASMPIGAVVALTGGRAPFKRG